MTVLIAARPGQKDVMAVAASRLLDYPPDKLEVLVARGRQPSAQRNLGIQAARGDLIYFLDDDSVPSPGNLERATPRFARPAVKMVGGPNLCPVDAPALEQVFALALSAWLAVGPSRARYAATGTLRTTSEKELILCNLLARRDVLLAHGGFNEALYPNEENALMDEIQEGGGELLYDPEMVVERRPRATLKAFARMLLTYGRGRAEQCRVHPTAGSALNLVPPMFVVYLAVLVATLVSWPKVGQWLLVPLAVYGLAVLAQAAALTAPRKGTSVRFASRLAAIPLMVLTHVLYGLGFWRGLFTSLKPAADRAPVEVQLERVKTWGPSEV